MFSGSRLLALLSFFFFIPSWAIGQQPASTSGSPASTPAPEPQSLADRARKLRKDKPAEIKMTDVDAKELFKGVRVCEPRYRLRQARCDQEEHRRAGGH